MSALISIFNPVKDSQFKTKMDAAENAAWLPFNKAVLMFFGNNKDPNLKTY